MTAEELRGGGRRKGNVERVREPKQPLQRKRGFWGALEGCSDGTRAAAEKASAISAEPAERLSAEEIPGFLVVSSSMQGQYVSKLLCFAGTLAIPPTPRLHLSLR